jgi:glutamate/tyrosine decarboxylase-like PLP-dependent enzyme
MSLGGRGLDEMIARCCLLARRFAQLLGAGGFDILNEVVLNQVLVSFGAPQMTRRVIDAIQADGTCWAGVTVWQGRTAMRISVSSWATTIHDVERSAAAIIRIAHQQAIIHR